MFTLFDNGFINVVAIIFIMIFCLFIFLYLLAQLIKVIPIIRRTVVKVIDYFYLILVPIPVLYLVIYHYNVKNGVLTSGFFLEQNLAVTIEKLSWYFFSVGIFSATLKYLNTITYVKNKFKEIILSKEFDDVLTKKLEILAYSNEYLINNNNIDEIWRTVTLAKYEKKFPVIYDKLKDVVYNNLDEESISFYYKHFDIDFDISLMEDNENVKFEIATRFTLVRASIEEFEWNFTFDALKEDFESVDENTLVYDTELNEEFSPVDSEKIDLGGSFRLKLKYNLSGKLEYNIKNTRTFTQRITHDRIYGFGSKRILDDLKVTIRTCDKMAVFFSSVNSIKFDKETKKNKEVSYIYRGLTTPGEKFKLFLIRN
ncbi:MAG: hypothetical protein P8K77_05435 [Polaribacter sp.]|nr:hypothetical protein [Polaribacter sp.]